MGEEQSCYRDDGCEIETSCLNCSLPRCIHDEPGGKRGQQRRQRNREIVGLRRMQRLKIGELARRYKVSSRTVYRILAQRGIEETSDE
jgi:hypothetical protein